VAPTLTRTDISVAFADSGGLDQVELTQPHAIYGFKLNIGPAIRTALLEELRSSFKSVEVVRKPDPALDKADLYAIPELKLAQILPAQNAEADFRLGVRLILVTRETKTVVGDYRQVVPVTIKAPLEARAATLAAVGSMFVLTPVVMPMRVDAVGREAEKTARAAIETAVRRLGDEMAGDRDMQQVAAIATTLGPIKEPAHRAPSQFDKYLDSVVVVGTNDGTGSGFFVSRDGYIATVWHVVRGQKTVSITDRNGRTMEGEVVALSREHDLALIKVEGTNFRPLPLASEVAPPAGREVVAVGAAQDLPWSVSKGIVSAMRSFKSARAIQTDAALGPGSSGGPLIDVASGRVLGIVSLGLGNGRGYASIAIAADEVRKAFAAQLRSL
jgi:S1-C subfamily serine protease